MLTYRDRDAQNTAQTLTAALTWVVPGVCALVAWIAAGTMIHGVGQIASAFLVREIGHDVAA